MKRDWQQRWARAYDRAKRRTDRRVRRVLELVDRHPDGRTVAEWKADTELRRADVLLGEAATFQRRVHSMLMGPRR